MLVPMLAGLVTAMCSSTASASRRRSPSQTSRASAMPIWKNFAQARRSCSIAPTFTPKRPLNSPQSHGDLDPGFSIQPRTGSPRICMSVGQTAGRGSWLYFTTAIDLDDRFRVDACGRPSICLMWTLWAAARVPEETLTTLRLTMGRVQKERDDLVEQARSKRPIWSHPSLIRLKSGCAAVIHRRRDGGRLAQCQGRHRCRRTPAQGGPGAGSADHARACPGHDGSRASRRCKRS